LAFAPQYSSTEINLKNYRQLVTRQRYRKNLYPIPGAKEEVESIKKLINTDIYEGLTATETNFKKIAGNYDILHLAMHTVIDNTDPMYSKLIFTLDNDTVNDGLLNTYEIFGLKLKARMVVLSACSTGNGEISKGEGVISLARGFVYSGVSSLVMTLWEVEDKSGAILMKDFYINLLKGQSKSAALRNAKIKFIKGAKAENSHLF
jgi:CHAT domain-containing protein